MQEQNEWWVYPPPPTIYDRIGNNFITLLFRPLFYIALRFYFRYFHHYHIISYNNKLGTGGSVIVANHSSHLDTLLIFSCLPFRAINQIYSVAAADYFFAKPILKVIAHLLCNIIPIRREVADLKSLSICIEIINNDGTILIYPEGTRTRTGRMGRFKPGVGLLVKKTRCMVYPVFITGTYESMNYRRVVPKPTPIKIALGSPLSYRMLIKKGEGAKEITEVIEKAVVELGHKLGKI